jgi:hypothetical protein
MSKGRAMAQAVSRWPLTAEARVRARVNPCGICGGQSGTGQVISEYFGFPCKYHSTIAPYTSITAPWGVRLLWPSSTLSQPRSSVRGFTSDPAHWLETEIGRKNVVSQVIIAIWSVAILWANSDLSTHCCNNVPTIFVCYCNNVQTVLGSHCWKHTFQH